MPNFDFINQFPRPDRFKITEVKKLMTNTLDTVITNKEVDIIKLDTQGSELSILIGAREILSEFLPIIFVEIEFERIYKDQPLAGDVIEYLKSLGYILMDLEFHKWSRSTKYLNKQSSGSQIVWADALFLPNPELLLAKEKELNFEKRLFLIKFFKLESYLWDLRNSDRY